MTESMWLSRLSPPVSQDNLSLKVMKTQSSRLTYRNDEDGISYGSSSLHIKTGELFLTRSNKILQTVIFSWAASSDEKYQANDEIATAIGWASSPLLLAGVTSSSSLIATGGLWWCTVAPVSLEELSLSLASIKLYISTLQSDMLQTEAGKYEMYLYFDTL